MAVAAAFAARPAVALAIALCRLLTGVRMRMRFGAARLAVRAAVARRRTRPARLQLERGGVGADRARRLEALHVLHRDVAAEQLLDLPQQVRFFLRDQRDRLAGGAIAAGAADAVDVILRDHRQVVVDHQRQVRDVEAARGDVGRDQDPRLARLELVQRLLPRRLALVAVDRHRRQAGFLQLLGQAVATVLGLAEHQHLLGVAAAEYLDQQRALLRAVDRVRTVGDGLRDGVLRGHLHFLRVVEELQRQCLDARLEGRREQQRLALLRQAVEDALDRRQEAHVEHAVGLVEDQHLHRVELHAAAVEVVDQAARAGHQHVHAAAQLVDLRLHADAAEQRGDVELEVATVGLEAVGDLHRQLAGGHQHQRARLARAGRRGFLAQAVEHRQRERGGLAGAGLGAAQHVAAGQHQRDRLLLDRGGGGVAIVGERAQQGRREAEGFERHVGTPD